MRDKENEEKINRVGRVREWKERRGTERGDEEEKGIKTSSREGHTEENRRRIKTKEEEEKDRRTGRGNIREGEEKKQKRKN